MRCDVDAQAIMDIEGAASEVKGILDARAEAASPRSPTVAISAVVTPPPPHPPPPPPPPTYLNIHFLIAPETLVIASRICS